MSWLGVFGARNHGETCLLLEQFSLLLVTYTTMHQEKVSLRYLQIENLRCNVYVGRSSLREQSMQRYNLTLSPSYQIIMDFCRELYCRPGHTDVLSPKWRSDAVVPDLFKRDGSLRLRWPITAACRDFGLCFSYFKRLDLPEAHVGYSITRQQNYQRLL